MDLDSLYFPYLLSLAMGLLVGLQREQSDPPVAGFRTFTLITLLGTLTGTLSQMYGASVLAVGLVSVLALMLAGNAMRLVVARSLSDDSSKQARLADTGMTSEAAALVMFGVGALFAHGELLLGVVVGGSVTLLLFLKDALHTFAGRLSRDDLKAIMQFVLLSCVVLPVLPDATFGPYDVLNPRSIWLMVVLIVGISLGGYITYRFMGHRAGLWVGGVLGGLISSTATTVSYSRRSTASEGELDTLAIFVITTASTIVCVRVLVEIGAVSYGTLLPSAIPPILILMAASAAFAAGAYVFARKSDDEMPEQKNPSELGSALVFGALYAGVLLALAAGRSHFGEAGSMAVSILSGLTDVDAITLSVSELVQRGEVSPERGWRLVMVATLSNAVFKTGVVAVLGSRKLLQWMVLYLMLLVVVGAALIWLWPAWVVAM